MSKEGRFWGIDQEAAGTASMNRRIFDAHLHIIDPAFPLVPNLGYLPDPFTVDDSLGKAHPLGVAGGAVASGSFQAFDQGYLASAPDDRPAVVVGYFIRSERKSPTV